MARTFSVPNARLKSLLARCTYSLINFLSRFNSGQTFLTLATLFTINQHKSTLIRGNEIKYSFVSGTWLPRRFTDVEILEPGTLSWIDNATRNTVLWDIGANVGGYAIYAAKSRAMTVLAFEPSPFNLEFLARNIWLNELEQKITVIPIALSEFTSQSSFQMKRTEWASSGSTYGEVDKTKYIRNDQFIYPTIGIPMDHVHSFLKLPNPNYVKLDVDGIEGLILAGGMEVLLGVTSVLVETPESEEQKKLVTECLRNAGLTRQEVVRQNEIWSRK